jgi:hypothetical protein
MAEPHLDLSLIAHLFPLATKTPITIWKWLGRFRLNQKLLIRMINGKRLRLNAMRLDNIAPSAGILAATLTDIAVLITPNGDILAARRIATSISEGRDLDRRMRGSLRKTSGGHSEGLVFLGIKAKLYDKNS